MTGFDEKKTGVYSWAEGLPDEKTHLAAVMLHGCVKGFSAAS